MIDPSRVYLKVLVRRIDVQRDVEHVRVTIYDVVPNVLT
jgi:hypothetical protein